MLNRFGQKKFQLHNIKNKMMGNVNLNESFFYSDSPEIRMVRVEIY